MAVWQRFCYRTFTNHPSLFGRNDMAAKSPPSVNRCIKHNNFVIALLGTKNRSILSSLPSPNFRPPPHPPPLQDLIPSFPSFPRPHSHPHPSSLLLVVVNSFPASVPSPSFLPPSFRPLSSSLPFFFETFKAQVPLCLMAKSVSHLISLSFILSPTALSSHSSAEVPPCSVVLS